MFRKILRIPGIGVIGMLILVYLLMLIFKPTPFLTLNNQLNILRGVSVLIIVCIGMTTVVVGRGIDLSVGSITGLCGGVCAFLLLRHFPVPIAFLAAILTGVAAGAFNGFLITRFGLGDFIVTLGTLYLYRGIYLVWAQGLPFVGYMNNVLWWMSTGKIAGVPVPLVFDVIFIIIFTFILRKTQLGTNIFAMGSNAAAAEMVGIRIKQLKLSTYMISGFLCAIGGLFLMARLTSITPHTGENMELDAIAAVLLGGTSLLGGRGSIYGSVLGAILVQVVSNLVTILQIEQHLLQTVIGATIIIAVGLDLISRNITVIRSAWAKQAKAGD
jgi:ribose/xylose/arabinose/galactoside ABC-type transport system permease subunit